MMFGVSEKHERNGFKITWRIENFSFFGAKEGNTLRTPEFIVDNLQATKWTLWLFPVSSAFKDHIACYLKRDSDKNGLAVSDLEAELSFLAFDGSSVKSVTFSGCVFKKGKSSPPLIAKRDEVLMHKRCELLSQDTLTVRCIIWNAKEPWFKEECFVKTRIRVERTAFIGVMEKFSTLAPSTKKAVYVRILSTVNVSLAIGVHITEDEIIFIDLMPLGYKNIQLCRCKLLLLDSVGKEIDFGQNEFSYFNKKPDVAWKIPLPLSKRNLINLREWYLPNDTLTFHCHIALSTGIEYNQFEEPQFLSGNFQIAVQEVLDDTSKCRPGTCFLWKNDLNSLHNDCILCDIPVSKNTKECTEYTQTDTHKYVTNLSEKGKGVLIPNVINFSTDNNLSDSLLSWKDELVSLFEGHILCDVILLTKSKSFPAHSLILSIRSSVLCDKGATVVRKKLNNCFDLSPQMIDLKDLDDDTVHQMLIFLYTDCIDGLEWERAKKLYFAADKYEILALKEKCSFFLLQNLQPINCCEILLLADKHQDKDTKKGVQLYIAQHNAKIIDDDQWRKLENTNPDLALETFRIMVLHCRKN